MGWKNKNPDVELNCQECMTFFIVPFKNRDRKFCTHTCYSKNHAKAIVGSAHPNWQGGKWNSFKKVCTYCGISFVGIKNRKCCSAECYKVNRTKENNPNWRGGMVDICVICKILISRGHSKCCSVECLRKYFSSKNSGSGNPMYGIQRYNEKNPNWHGGVSREPYAINWTSQLKLKIRVRDNFKCQQCGVPELETGRSSDIHHIDYVKKNCTETNLISLCDSCHSKTQSNRKYWTEYYQEKIGKIYAKKTLST